MVFFYLFQLSGLTLVKLESNQIRLKKWNRVTALLCVNTFETKVKETITLGNQKGKKKKRDRNKVYQWAGVQQKVCWKSFTSAVRRVNHSYNTTHSLLTVAVCLQYMCLCVSVYMLNSPWRTSRNSPACWWHSTPLEDEVLSQSAGRQSNKESPDTSDKRLEGTHSQTWQLSTIIFYHSKTSLMLGDLMRQIQKRIRGSRETCSVG